MRGLCSRCRQQSDTYSRQAGRQAAAAAGGGDSLNDGRREVNKRLNVRGRGE